VIHERGKKRGGGKGLRDIVVGKRKKTRTGKKLQTKRGVAQKTKGSIPMATKSLGGLG